ncbi:4-aminobutyrate--2-oxoglutarate transaminase [Desulforudis sp. DRI-14]|uniref:4-aminobutyrate--2-oxoglutarate transaminase n=1 Tax=Desulforudis sp. DRI-14 TaxID=3459793 RepID=UPI003BEC3466
MPKIQGEFPGPKASALLAKRREFVARGVSNIGPFFAARAQGARIVDVDGNEFLDFVAGIGTINIGHSHPRVVRAVTEQAGMFTHTCFNIAMYEPYLALAEKLAAITPGDFPKKVMFANSGAEAVENAVKIARRATGRPGVIGLECGFHGRTLLAMTLTSKVRPYKYGFGPFAPDVYKIPSGYCYRCYFGLSYPSCDLRCVQNLERFFLAEQAADKIAVLVAEPVQGEGGFIVPPPEFLPGLRDICTKYGILFVADEIQTGFGRTGRLFACEHWGLVPDMITVAKSLAGGLPLSGVIGRAEVMDAPEPGEIGGTYSGNPVACAAALEVLDIIREENLCRRAAQIGGKMQESLRALQERYPCIGDVRGLGAMVAIELVEDRKTKEPARELTDRVAGACRKRGLLVLTAGVFGNVLRFLAPLVVTDAELNEAMAILDEALSEASTAGGK